MTPPPAAAALAVAHVPHHGNHEGYACGFSAEHCWACGEPWPCRVSRGFPRCDRCAECDLECNCNGHTGIHGTPPAVGVTREGEGLRAALERLVEADPFRNEEDGFANEQRGWAWNEMGAKDQAEWRAALEQARAALASGEEGQ